MALPAALATNCNIPTSNGLRGTNLHIICDAIHLQIAQVRLLFYICHSWYNMIGSSSILLVQFKHI